MDQSSLSRIDPLAEFQAHAVQIEHVLAQPRRREPLQGQGVPRLRLVGDQIVGRLDAELRLRRPRGRSAPQPRQFLAHQVAPACLGACGQPRPFGAGQHVGRVSALVGVDVAVVHLPDARADGVEEPPVVADHHERLRAQLRQVARQPPDDLDVEVVGRLVEHQHVVAGQQHRGQRHPAPLTAAEIAHLAVQADVGEQVLDHRPGVGFRRPDVVGTASDDHVPDRGVRGEVVGLVQVAHGQARGVGDAARIGRSGRRQHLQQRRLAVAVAADDADRLALVDAEADAVRAGSGCRSRRSRVRR